MPLAHDVEGTYIDYIEFEPYGVIRVSGWTTAPAALPCQVVTLEGVLRPSVIYRFERADVSAHTGSSDGFLGISVEFVVRGKHVQSVILGTHSVQVPEDAMALLLSETPAYVELLSDSKVRHRKDIYAEGPPAETVHPEIFKFASLLAPDILDFGCGSGALVRQLRQIGLPAFGIEIDRPAIRKSLQPDVSTYVELYEGRLPLPYDDGRFQSVIATEVIEHIPDYIAIIAEIARVCRNTFAITVPDMTCIPVGHRIGMVPWHLLEGTHVNFFTHRSLAKVLEPYFDVVHYYQLARCEIGGVHIPGCLAAIATKREAPTAWR